jgi:hypothetical protein
MEKFKTMNENKVMINPPTESLVDKIQVTQLLNNMSSYVLSLDRYECNTNSGGQDCWSTMDLDRDGEWIKLEDVLSLFSAKKS